MKSIICMGIITFLIFIVGACSSDEVVVGQLFVHPTFNYSILIPPGFEDTNPIKEYHEPKPSSVSTKIFLLNGGTEQWVRLTIGVIMLGNLDVAAAVRGAHKNLTSLQFGENYTGGYITYTKIKNVDIDGCVGSEVLSTNKQEKVSFYTVCLIDQRQIGIRLQAETKDVLDAHRQIYDAAVDSVKFK